MPSPTRSLHAGVPFTDDDATIAAALEDVSIPTLMVSMVHMSGDPELIRGRIRPQGMFLNEVPGLHVRGGQGRGPRDRPRHHPRLPRRGCTLPPPPSRELVHEMMSWLVCEEVPENYVPLLLEELELDGVDSRKVELSADGAAAGRIPRRRHRMRRVGPARRASG